MLAPSITFLISYRLEISDIYILNNKYFASFATTTNPLSVDSDMRNEMKALLAISIN